jgi:hypothetical protein
MVEYRSFDDNSLETWSFISMAKGSGYRSQILTDERPVVRQVQLSIEEGPPICIW